MELSVVTLGEAGTDSFDPLTRHLSRLEQVVTNLPPRVELADARAVLNRAIDAAASDWILILRERESIGEPLAEEIAAAMRAGEAWGFRVRIEVIYAGRPLRLGRGPGELRLFHRRHLLRRGDLAVQGAVIRLRSPLRAQTFGSTAEHRAFLAKRGVPHSWVRRTLLFLRNARTLDANTLRYVWIESGFDQGG